MSLKSTLAPVSFAREHRVLHSQSTHETVVFRCQVPRRRECCRTRGLAPGFWVRPAILSLAELLTKHSREARGPTNNSEPCKELFDSVLRHIERTNDVN